MNSPTFSDLQKLSHIHNIYFAIFCAEQVFHLVSLKDKEVCRVAIDTAMAFTQGKATQEKCNSAASAASATAYAAATASAAAYAANAAANAAYAAYAASAYAASYASASAAAHAAANAAYAAANATANATANAPNIVQAQWDYYNELLNYNEIFESVVLK